jgi:hypothetical protein
MTRGATGSTAEMKARTRAGTRAGTGEEDKLTAATAAGLSFAAHLRSGASSGARYAGAPRGVPAEVRRTKTGVVVTRNCTWVCDEHAVLVVVEGEDCARRMLSGGEGVQISGKGHREVFSDGDF